MNKKYLKSTLVVAMVAVTGYGSYKAYEGYAESSNWLLLENIEALANNENQNKQKMYCFKSSQIIEDTYATSEFLVCPSDDNNELDCRLDNYTVGIQKNSEEGALGTCWGARLK